MIRRLIAATFLGAMAFAVSAQPGSGEWPTKPVKIIVPYSPGGTSDVLGRLVAQQLQAALKQPFVVENRGGAGGTIGSTQVAKAPPDGYTLVISGIGSHVIAPVEINSFNAMRDFTHVVMLGGPPTVLVVHPSTGIDSVRSLVAYAQRTNGGYSWGSPGQGTHGYLIGELFAKVAKVTHTHVSYKGAAPAMSDLVSGQLPVAFTTYTSANAFIKAGKVRALAVTSPTRLADMPDVPTFAELGFPDLVATTWFALSGPAALPPAIVRRLNTEVRAALKTPAARKQLAGEGIQAPDLDVPAVEKFFTSEIERWTPLVQSVARPKNQ